MTEIGVLLAIAVAVSVMVGFLVGVATEGRSRKEAPTPDHRTCEELTADALSLVMAEQYRAGKESGRAESMRRRVGREPHQVAMEQAREAG